MNALAAVATIEGVLLLYGMGNTVGYHRLLTHRAFRAPPAVRAGFAFLGALHSGPPLLWVGLHRHHHLRSDGPDDPHTPRHRGFWYGHTGWLLERLTGMRATTLGAILFAASGFGQQLATVVHDVRRLRGTNPPEWLALCPDLLKEPALVWLEKPLVTVALFALQVAIAVGVFGWPGLVALWGIHLLLTNASWAVNSICHSPGIGTAPHPTGDDSRDVAWLAPFTLGEAFHNSHHRYPRSACHGLGGRFDPSWWIILALVRVGLASEPWLPKSEREKAA